MKPSLLLIAMALFASSAQAQHSHMPPTEGGGSATNNFGAGGWGGSSAWGSSSFGSHPRGLAYESPREFTVGYATNDGPFVPSTYMNYDDALALGRQQLATAEKAAQGEAYPPLGDVARAYRAVKIPTLKLQARVVQDNSGKLTVCNLNGNDCHRP